VNKIVRVLPPLTLFRSSSYSFYISADIHLSLRRVLSLPLSPLLRASFITSESTTQRSGLQFSIANGYYMTELTSELTSHKAQCYCKGLNVLLPISICLRNNKFTGDLEDALSGTKGYAASEYVKMGRLTTKTD
ncbi:hypothetical protein Tco_1249725, partial [Tanacetum coccineum]